jgi:succinoglycan biosynthesis protein ExoO
MATPAPVVSVIMPAYKAAAFIGWAVESLRAQTFTAWELVVVDDCSPDDTAAVVEALAAEEPRIRLLRQKRNGGPAAARNAGLEAAKGTWIAVLDADDAYTPGRLQHLLSQAEAHGLDLIADNQLLFDASANRIVRQGFALRGDSITWDVRRHFRYDRPGSGFFTGWLKIMVRAAFLKDHGLRYNEKYRFGEDFLFSAELLAAGAKAEISATPGYIYTLPKGEVSGIGSGQSLSNPSLPQMAEASQGFLQTYGSRLSAAERRSVAARLVEVADNRRILTAFDLLQQKKVAAALTTLLNHPMLFLRRQIWYCTYVMVWRRLLKLPRTTMVLR